MLFGQLKVHPYHLFNFLVTFSWVVRYIVTRGRFWSFCIATLRHGCWGLPEKNGICPPILILTLSWSLKQWLWKGPIPSAISQPPVRWMLANSHAVQSRWHREITKTIIQTWRPAFPLIPKCTQGLPHGKRKENFGIRVVTWASCISCELTEHLAACYLPSEPSMVLLTVLPGQLKMDRIKWSCQKWEWAISFVWNINTLQGSYQQEKIKRTQLVRSDNKKLLAHRYHFLKRK